MTLRRKHHANAVKTRSIKLRRSGGCPPIAVILCSDFNFKFFEFCRTEISSYASKCYVVSAGLLVAVAAGAAVGYPSVLLFQLRKNDTPIEINLDSSSWIGSVHGLAGLLSIVMPTIMQWKGRKFAFIMSSTSILFGWILMYFANSVSTILISECFHGFGGNGLYTVGSLCLSEMVTPKYRNVFILIYNSHHGLGLALVTITIKTLHWRFVSFVFIVPLIVGIVIAFTWPESPFWLAWKGHTNECEKNFIWLRGTDEESTNELKELIAAEKEKRQRKQKTNLIKKIYNDVTSKDCYKPGIHIVLLYGTFYFSGAMVILLYSVEMIQRTSKDENVAFIGATSNNFLVLLGAVLSGVLVKRFKNKTVLLTSAFGSAIGLLLASVVTYLQHIGVLSKESQLCLYCLLGQTCLGTLGMYSLSCAIPAELMPVRYRGIGGCLSMLCTCILHALTLKTAPYLFLYIDLYGTFLLYSCNIIIFSILIWKFIPETKNKTLQDLENFYMYGKFESKLLKKDSEKEHMFSNNEPL